MTSSDLTADQISAIDDKMRSYRCYLESVQKRMVELQFPQDDPLRAAVDEAHRGTAALCVLLFRTWRTKLDQELDREHGINRGRARPG